MTAHADDRLAEPKAIDARRRLAEPDECRTRIHACLVQLVAEARVSRHANRSLELRREHRKATVAVGAGLADVDIWGLHLLDVLSAELKADRSRQLDWTA